MGIGIVDCLVIPDRPGLGSSPRDAVGYLFSTLKDRPKETTLEYLMGEMDEVGVEKAVLSIQEDRDKDWVLEAARKYPSRFVPAMAVNPHNGMDEIRKVDRMVKEHGIQVIRMGPWRIQKPPNDKIYYPFYTKAIELDIIVQVNVGLPGPKTPGWVQDPIYLDEVCYFYPELKVMMTHIGMPWIHTVIYLLGKWENIYLVSSSYSPKYWPQELVQAMNTRCRHKVLFGTEHPIMPMKRALKEIENIPLRDEVRPLFLRENALRLLKFEK